MSVSPGEGGVALVPVSLNEPITIHRNLFFSMSASLHHTVLNHWTFLCIGSLIPVHVYCMVSEGETHTHNGAM